MDGCGRQELGLDRAAVQEAWAFGGQDSEPVHVTPPLHATGLNTGMKSDASKKPLSLRYKLEQVLSPINLNHQLWVE